MGWEMLLGFPAVISFVAMSDGTRLISENVLTSAPSRVLSPPWEQECVFWSWTDPGAWHLQFFTPGFWEQSA